jgi:hypothetical protein
MIEIGLGERQRFLYAQPGAPEDHDQAAQASPVHIISRRAHDGDDLFDPGRVGGIP